MLVARCDGGGKKGGVIVREKERCYAGTGAEMSNIWKRWKEDKENMEEESGAAARSFIKQLHFVPPFA